MKIDPCISYSTVLVNYSLREEELDGKQYVIAPVVLMVEGVHTGSQGPVLYTAQELSKFSAAWNGRPLPVFHPEEGGESVSCNSPEIIKKQSVGFLFNVYFTENKLKGEVWVDKEKCTRISPQTLLNIMAKVPMDVSTGMFNDLERSGGTWTDGKKYESIAQNIRPDHLALLPGGKGACSQEDGCGIRTNQGGADVRLNSNSMTPEKIKKIRELTAEGWLITQARPGYRQAMEAIQNHLNTMDNPSTFHFVEELWDDHFVYSRNTDQGDSNLFTQGYVIKEGKLELGDTAKEVRKDIEYVVLSAMGNNKQGEKSIMKTIDALIQNQATNFKETDRAWLETFSECDLLKLVPKEQEPVVNVNTNDKPKDVSGMGDTPIVNKDNAQVPETLTKEEAISIFRDQFKTKEQVLEFLPPELADQFKDGLALTNVARAELIERITTHSKSWTKEELEAKGTEDLRKLDSMIPKSPDYSGNGNNSLKTTNTEEPELLLPVAVYEALKTEEKEVENK